MKNRDVLAGVLVFLIASCLCPALFAVVYVGLESLAGREARDLATLLFLGSCCGGLIVLAFGGLGWQLWHLLRSRKAGRRLAAAMGLAQLNQAAKQMAIWYGGEHDGRPFAIKPFGTTRRYYWHDGRRRITANFRLRVLMQVQIARPLSVDVYRDFKEGARDPRNFDEAFVQKNGAWLSKEAQEAMFAFVQQGYPTGLDVRTLSLRIAKGTRKLRLCDRATAAEELLLPADVLPDAHVILVHDHPRTTITAEELGQRLDEMALIVRAVEESARRLSRHPLVWR